MPALSASQTAFSRCHFAKGCNDENFGEVGGSGHDGGDGGRGTGRFGRPRRRHDLRHGVENITWLQNWNTAAGSSYDDGSSTTDGRMSWSSAVAWADNLVHGGYSDWRLPTMEDTGAAGCNFSFAGGTDCGSNVQTMSGGTVYSEMAHLFYETLGNKAYCPPGDDLCAGAPQDGWGLKNTGPFNNMLSDGYWFGLQYAPQSSHAWFFLTGSGRQGIAGTSGGLYAVAVRHGNVAAAVPEPQTLVLTMLALAAAMVAHRKRPL